MNDSKRRCPCCGAPVKFESNPYRPFCSKRCKLSDLRAWFREEYVIVTEERFRLESQTMEDDSLGTEGGHGYEH